MALFFDSQWFDARLASAGLTKSAVAAALGLDDEQIADVWKDQRELKAADVRMLATLLGSTPKEIADRAGVSTPVPKDASPDAALLNDLNERLMRVERALAEIKALVLDLRSKAP